MTGSLDLVADVVERWREQGARPFVPGICGAQGSGKSTLAEGLAARLDRQGLRVAILSLDDLYLPRERRPVDISPLFATRGVPGTHDVALGMRVLAGLKSGQPTRLPRFDKATDAPMPENQWPVVTAPDVVIFEGWCVGARPQTEIDKPVNALEETDVDGVWRRAVNSNLAGSYAELFNQIDKLVFLAAPDFSVVREWRVEQEHSLRQRLEAEGRQGDKVMNDDEIRRFIQYYERLTRHILRTMPDYADLILWLDRNRKVLPVKSGELNSDI